MAKKAQPKMAKEKFHWLKKIDDVQPKWLNGGGGAHVQKEDVFFASAKIISKNNISEYEEHLFDKKQC